MLIYFIFFFTQYIFLYSLLPFYLIIQKFYVTSFDIIYYRLICLDLALWVVLPLLYRQVFCFEFVSILFLCLVLLFNVPVILQSSLSLHPQSFLLLPALDLQIDVQIPQFEQNQVGFATQNQPQFALIFNLVDQLIQQKDVPYISTTLIFYFLLYSFYILFNSLYLYFYLYLYLCLFIFIFMWVLTCAIVMLIIVMGLIHGLFLISICVVGDSIIGIFVRFLFSIFFFVPLFSSTLLLAIISTFFTYSCFISTLTHLACATPPAYPTRPYKLSSDPDSSIQFSIFISYLHLPLTLLFVTMLSIPILTPYPTTQMSPFFLTHLLVMMLLICLILILKLEHVLALYFYLSYSFICYFYLISSSLWIKIAILTPSFSILITSQCSYNKDHMIIEFIKCQCK